MLYLFTADGVAFGRVDYASLSEQSLMELLIADIQNLSDAQNSNGEFLDISKWKGIKLCDGAVTKIALLNFDAIFAEVIPVGPRGSIDLQWLPRKLQAFDIQCMGLTGSIETGVLPRHLLDLNISENAFFGTFAVKNLPEAIKYINLRNNKLHGSLHIEHLPREVNNFQASGNAFSGELHFANLPASIQQLNLDRNDFTGSIDLSAIPPGILFLRIHKTKIAQERLVIAVPKDRIKGIFVDKENFQQVVDVNGKDIKGELP